MFQLQDLEPPREVGPRQIGVRLTTYLLNRSERRGELMATYFICYDLVKDSDYGELIDALKQEGAEKIILSDWKLKAYNTSCTELAKKFRKHIDSDDRLLVIKAVNYDGFNLLS